MATKQPQRKIYTTMQGKQVDIDALRQRNELTPAVGNARVNARGDELGAGGQIIKKHEDIINEYYTGDRRHVVDEPTHKTATTPDPVVEPTVQKSKKTTAKSKVQETEIEETTQEDEWVEDEDGNFVKRGE